MSDEKTYANLAISRLVYDQFREICDERGKKYSWQVEKLMKEFIETNED
jgi:hypothetical protein